MKKPLDGLGFWQRENATEGVAGGDAVTRSNSHLDCGWDFLQLIFFFLLLPPLFFLGLGVAEVNQSWCYKVVKKGAQKEHEGGAEQVREAQPGCELSTQ